MKTYNYDGMARETDDIVDIEAERAEVVLSKEYIGFEMPDRLKHFTSVQNGRLIMVMGGQNSIIENPFDLFDGD